MSEQKSAWQEAVNIVAVKHKDGYEVRGKLPDFTINEQKDCFVVSFVSNQEFEAILSSLKSEAGV
jgi:hypothetical protein